MKFCNYYRPYLPAITSFIGAAMVAIGWFLGRTYPTYDNAFQELKFVGALIAPIGALWSVHRQIVSSAENKDLTKKIISMSEQLQNHVTGGDSFCYAYPIFNLVPPDFFNWMVVHVGSHPISEVSVRICNLNRSDHGILNLLGTTLKLGTIFPGRIHNFPHVEPKKDTGSYNLFFLARNGSLVNPHL